MSQLIFLGGKKIYLRALQQEDLNINYLQWLNDAEVCRYNSHAVFPNTDEKMRAFFNRIQSDDTKQVILAIIDKKSKGHVGNVSLQNINWVARNAEFAILIGEKKMWGKGIGEEAAGLICDYGFSRLNLHRIYCGTIAENSAMQKLAEKLKMKKEGVRRESVFKDGKYRDVVEYGVLKNEFYRNQK